MATAGPNHEKDNIQDKSEDELDESNVKQQEDNVDNEIEDTIGAINDVDAEQFIRNYRVGTEDDNIPSVSRGDIKADTLRYTEDLLVWMKKATLGQISEQNEDIAPKSADEINADIVRYNQELLRWQSKVTQGVIIKQGPPSSEPAGQYISGYEKGTILESAVDRYKIGKFLGCGTFGCIFKCTGLRTKRKVAVKILRDANRPYGGQLEFLFGTLLMGAQPFVRMIDYFEINKRSFLVMELLGQPLSEYIEKNGPLDMNVIKIFTWQILQGLDKLKTLCVLHGDLKPANIVLQNGRDLLVKIVDYGSVIFKKLGSTSNNQIQSLHYRAPEVFIRTKLTMSVDMWSLGCIMAEMLLTIPLFPAHNEENMLYLIHHFQPLPSGFLDRGSSTSRYYDKNVMGKYALKVYEIYVTPTINSLEDLLVLSVDNDGSGGCLAYLSLVNQMLRVDPLERITPARALQHDFFCKSDGGVNYPSTSSAAIPEI